MNDQASTPAPSGSHDPNQHIYDFLDYYTDFAEPPKYAVLIVGPWGVGKTHLVKQYLLKKFGGRKREPYVYVSLFGVRSAAEIDDALYAKLHPLASSKGAKLVGRAVSIALKHGGYDIGNFTLRSLLKRKVDLYIFDDVERARMAANEVLGYINAFVEQDGAKAIIIANEQELNKDSSYKTQKEKLIGRTFRVRSVFRDALQSFISRLSNPEFSSLLSRCVEDIEQIYSLSELDNLRLLQQSIWDFQRIYESLSHEHQQHDMAMVAALRLFFPLSFEFRAGRIDASQLRSRPNGLIAAMYDQLNKENPEGWATELRERYAGVDVLSGLFNNEILVNVLVDGFVPADKLRIALNSSPYFESKQAEPSWQTVWHFYERPDDLFKTALADMEDRFARREYNLHGEILHVFSLRLWLASEQLIAATREEVRQQCTSYVDDLKASARLLPMSTRFELWDMHESYGGLGYHESKSQDFQELARYINKQRNDVFKESLPTQAGALLKLLGDNYEQFASRVGNPHVEEGENFYNTPVLAAMNPAVFVEALDNLLPHQQRRVLLSLSARYAHRNVTRDLPGEVGWLRSVKRLLEDATGLSVLAQKRRAKFAEWFIDPILKEVASEEATATSQADDESTEVGEV